MAEITESTISSDLKSVPDQIWTAQALPNATTLNSDVFKLGQTMGGVETKVVVETAGTLTAAVTIRLQVSDASDGTFVTENAVTVPLGAVAVGDEIARMILAREVCDKLYARVQIVTTADESAIKVDAYHVFVS